MKTLIVDSGATKTDWLYVDGNETSHIKTEGLHPSYILDTEDFENILSQVQILNPDQIFFFGAGCGNPVGDEIVSRFLSRIFRKASIQVKSDLEGAGKAFFGSGDGIVGILGTGAIAARIVKGRVETSSASLGYAIGDEGSAADLGRRILKMYYRKTCTETTHAFIGERIGDKSYGDMMNRIYRAGKPNRILASVAGEVLSGSFPDEMRLMIKNAFSEYADEQLSMLNLTGEEEIVITGKVAEVHREILISLLNSKGFRHVHVRYPVVAAFRERIKTGTEVFGNPG
ncbi:MAG: hypothetical protein EA360_03765 [Balneolaceae bacterium]|nr:MAG: hypothetical protein EA360_03765 [Balneolaceae bacterium]